MAVSWQDAHIAQAAHNINLFNQLQPQSGNNQFTDWKSTILFYTALHLVHARVVVALGENEYDRRMRLPKYNNKIPKEKLYITAHNFFNQFICPIAKYQGLKYIDNPHIADWNVIQLDPIIYDAYFNLYGLSRQARYLDRFNSFEGLKFNSDFIDNALWIKFENLEDAHLWTNQIISFLQNQNPNLVTTLPTLNQV